MLIKQVSEILKNRSFVSVATCDLSGNPNAAPKFFLKIHEHYLYLIDYTFGRTWENLKINPKASLSFVDTETLISYQVNGKVETIDTGKEFGEILKEMVAKEVSLSTKRIIEGVTTGKKHLSFEIGIREKFFILKLKIEEIVEIGSNGEIKREKI